MQQSEHRLPADIDAPAKSRRLVEGWVNGHDRLHALVLAVSELVTNAVVHGAPATELTVRFSSTGSMIRVAVVNLGGVFDPQLERGYSGLRIVDRIVDRWGIEPLNDSVEVWFEVDDVPVDVDVQTSATAL